MALIGTKVLIIGKSNGFNMTLADIISSFKRIEVVSNPLSEAIKNPCLNCELVIIDLTTLSGRIKDIISEVKSEYPSSKLIALHHKNNTKMKESILESGADAFLQTDMTYDELVHALRQFSIPSTKPINYCLSSD